MISVDLARRNVTDAGLEQLKGFTQLQSLNLTDTKVTDAGLESLEGLKKLKSLNLTNTNVTDEGLESLEGLKKARIAGPIANQGNRRRAGEPRRVEKTQIARPYKHQRD